MWGGCFSPLCPAQLWPSPQQLPFLACPHKSQLRAALWLQLSDPPTNPDRIIKVTSPLGALWRLSRSCQSPGGWSREAEQGGRVRGLPEKGTGFREPTQSRPGGPPTGDGFQVPDLPPFPPLRSLPHIRGSEAQAERGPYLLDSKLGHSLA